MAKESITLDQLYEIVKGAYFQAEFTTLFSGSNNTSALTQGGTWKLSQSVTDFSMIEIFIGDDVNGNGRENWYCMITPDVLKNSNRSLSGVIYDANNTFNDAEIEWFNIGCLNDGVTLKCYAHGGSTNSDNTNTAALQLVRGIKWSLKLGGGVINLVKSYFQEVLQWLLKI